MNENLIFVGMPIFEGKRIQNVGVKVNQQEKDAFEGIAKKLDRPVSYVVRHLALRGLSLYQQDGNLKLTEGEEKAITNGNKQPVVDAETDIKPSKKKTA